MFSCLSREVLWSVFLCPSQTLTLTAPPPVSRPLSHPATATSQTTAPTQSSHRAPPLIRPSPSWTWPIGKGNRVLHTPQLKCEIIHPNIQPLVTMIPASCSCLFFFYIRMIYYLTRSSSCMSLFLSVSSSLFLFHISFPPFFYSWFLESSVVSRSHKLPLIYLFAF